MYVRCKQASLARIFVHKMCFTCKSLSHHPDSSLILFPSRYDFNLGKEEAQGVHYNIAKEELCARVFFIHAPPKAYSTPHSLLVHNQGWTLNILPLRNFKFP